MVDALVSGTSGASREGSSPFLGTMLISVFKGLAGNFVSSPTLCPTHSKSGRAAKLKTSPRCSLKPRGVMAADQTTGCVIQITVIAMRVCYSGTMTSIHSYEGWWDLSLIDDRNERALLSAFVAVVAVWATIFLFALF